MSNILSHTGINYVIAIIRLPLEIHPDGTFTALNENIEFEFQPIKELPVKKENGIELATIELDEIVGLLSLNNKKNEPKIIETLNSTLSDKRKKRIRNKNTTFKNISSSTHNYSTKSWK